MKNFLTWLFYGITDIERALYHATGIKLYLLSIRWRVDSYYIQKRLDNLHDYPDINLED